MRRHTILLRLVVLCVAIHVIPAISEYCGEISAQQSAIYSSADASLTEGIRLYEAGHYAASQRILNTFLAGEIAEDERDEAEFYFAVNAFELRQKNAAQLLKAYAKVHTYSPYLSEVHFMQGVLWAEKRKFKQALKELDLAQSKDLFSHHVDACLFYKGYSHLHMQEPQAALGFFSRLHNNEASLYYLQSRYYYAYCQYVLGNFVKALPDFLFVEQTTQYSGIAPYYIIQIYYAQQQYDEVLARADKLLKNDPKNENNCELYRILGEISYHNGEYAEAIDHFKHYSSMAEEQNAALVREDLYLLGMSCYELHQYDDAVNYFKKVKLEGDSLSQSTQYHLGNALVKSATDADRSAKLAQAKVYYGAAMRMTFSKKLREEAMFNYALTTYQSSTALGESVTAFMDFLKDFPKSEHRPMVYSLLSDAFMMSKNYGAALDALEKIEEPDKRMLETKQYLRYQIGTDFFLQGKHKQALKHFEDVLSNAADSRLASSKDNRTYKTEALYMKAEAAFRLQQYDIAAQAMAEFQKQPNAGSSKNYELAQYLEGYIRFQQRDYKAAESSFLGFVQVADAQTATYADALNRIGDCYFSQRDFVKAESYYAKVIALGASGADYAIFQRGYALGLLKRYGDKIATLDRLVSQFPRSDYADDGLYEIARAELQREDNNAAIEAYDRLLATYPNSNMARKAALGKAMIFYNMHKTNEAIDAYKAVIKNYPSTEEAYAALDGMEVCYVETNRVTEYLAYTKTLGRINMKMTSNKEDSLTYIAAELQYMQGNYKEAAEGLRAYLDNYCDGGRYCTAAQYFCADAYYQLGNKDAALLEFKNLCEMKANPYMETSLLRAAELTYDREDYPEALKYFRRLQKQSSEIRTSDIARLGILRCSYLLGDNTSVIEVATELIDDPATVPDTRNEALYNRGKAYFAQGLYLKAIDDLRPLAEETRTAVGAEAKYLIAEALFNQGDLDEAETEVMSFAQMNTSQQYWLAKAFILLADIYTRRGDDFQAEQYLLSLQANYHGQNDDIAPTIEERLQLLNERKNDRVEEPEDAEASADEEDL